MTGRKRTRRGSTLASQPKRVTQRIPEGQRHTEQVKLRVVPLVAHAIAERAAELGIDKSAYVSRLVVDDVARASHQSCVAEEKSR